MKNMEVILDFNEELARKIKNGEVAGSFITNDGDNAEFVYISKREDEAFVFLFIEEGKHERALWADREGVMSGTGKCIKIKCDVRQAFKDGDVLVSCRGNAFLYNGIVDDEKEMMGCHCGISITDSICVNINNTDMYTNWTLIRENGECVRFATKEEKRSLIRRLKALGSESAIKILKSYFKNEMFDDVKNLKPFDRVLVKSFDQDEWNISLFHRVGKDGEDTVYRCLNGVEWDQCVPYEGNEYLLKR